MRHWNTLPREAVDVPSAKCSRSGWMGQPGLVGGVLWQRAPRKPCQQTNVSKPMSANNFSRQASTPRSGAAPHSPAPPRPAPRPAPWGREQRALPAPQPISAAPLPRSGGARSQWARRAPCGGRRGWARARRHGCRLLGRAGAGAGGAGWGQGAPGWGSGGWGRPGAFFRYVRVHVSCVTLR